MDPKIRESDLCEMIERLASALQRGTTPECLFNRCHDPECPKRALVLEARALARAPQLTERDRQELSLQSLSPGEVRPCELCAGNEHHKCETCEPVRTRNFCGCLS